MSEKVGEVYGIAIIGTGAIAEIHAKAIAEIGQAQLIGVYNRTVDKAVAFATRYDCDVFRSMDDISQDSRVSIVCICTASGFHLEPALKCLQSGKHCLIEKPLEISSERCDQLIEAASLYDRKLGVVFHSRFYPVSKVVKNAVDTGRLSELVLGSAYVKWHRSPAYYTSADWRGTWALDGGGVLMNQAIHSIDLLQWFAGEVTSVHSIVRNILHKNIEVEDTVVAMLNFQNGAVGTIEATTAAFPGAYKRIELIGTKGSIILEEDYLHTWDFDAVCVEDEGIKKQYSSLPTAGGVADPMNISYLGHKMQIIDFIEAIEEDKKPLVDGAEGRKSVQIIEAIYKSAKTGKEVFLNG
ncbi:Gfo/Idh/MocA family oxidoreductase [Sphingobacterium sp. UT-1RO-CII-1]|uniref:Gfo/Idh/MocA family protein n=1 Tax=Sphingobacterium sp. UT-1RO-CII-1 TaxID=2995225 RepID=UPI00227B29AE|nr:Gfo/Idh/MocA family oxidoreductase [Sphingobacterium sp. UT-1RO-CII-1]MCY4778219.1 Gfo/Idh/MocA family oxidoreductase [Sphingobacterium sp. UT-1RO-CII-1]